MWFPTVCPCCGRNGPAPCPACRALLVPARALAVPPQLDACSALLDWDDPARALVTSLKYRNARSALPWVAAGLAGLVTGRPAAVTWAPTTPQRRHARGFDQAELIARGVARHLGCPAVGLLRREPGPHQTGLDLAARRAAPRFTARRTAARRLARLPPGGEVLLVDDVVTTGTTLTRAASVLRREGAGRVVGLAIARKA